MGFQVEAPPELPPELPALGRREDGCSSGSPEKGSPGFPLAPQHSCSSPGN